MKPLYIIANPHAGANQGSKVLQAVQNYLTQRAIPFITLMTQYQGHTSVVTQQVIHKMSLHKEIDVIVIGGDGTLHEVVNTFVKAHLKQPITYIPAGTGNDFARTWLDKVTIEAHMNRYLFSRNITTIPLIKMNNLKTNESDIILNSLGIGLDGNVMHAVNQIPTDSFIKQRLSGSFAYLVGVIKAVRKLDHFDVMISANNQATTLTDCQYISIMNSPYLGGGIRLSNDVQAKQPIISLVAFHKVTTLSLLKILWQIIIAKKQPATQHYHFQNFETLEIKITDKLLSQVDGELRPTTTTHLQFELTEYPFVI